MTAKTRTPERAVRLELRKIKAAHPDLIAHSDAVAAMERLARLRCRFAELSAIIERAGGASDENLSVVGECRQLSRAAGTIERDLRMWLTLHPAQTFDSFALLGEARRRLISRAAAAESIPGESEPVQEPFSPGRLIRHARDLD